MALKKSDLRAILKNEDSTTEEKLSELLNLMHDEVDAVKDDRDAIAEELKTAKADLEEAKKNAGTNSSEWEQKYNDEHKAFEDYKTEQANKETRVGKENAFKSLLKEIGIGDKIAELLLSKADLDALEVEDGKFKNAEELSTKYKEEYKDYIINSSTSGASTATPPGTAGGNEQDLGNLSMDDYIKARSK